MLTKPIVTWVGWDYRKYAGARNVAHLEASSKLCLPGSFVIRKNVNNVFKF